MAVRTGLEPVMVLPTPDFESGRIPLSHLTAMEPPHRVELCSQDYESRILPNKL